MGRTGGPSGVVCSGPRGPSVVVPNGGVMVGLPLGFSAVGSHGGMPSSVPEGIPDGGRVVPMDCRTLGVVLALDS